MVEFYRGERPVHGWQGSKGRREELLLERYPMLGSGERARDERGAEEIAQYSVGDLFLRSFSTTSPPAFVRNEYIVTRKDKEGLWGRAVQGEVEEFTAEDVE
ncbi:hypothetical protein LCGC14_2153410 [marine sediment metagenome]|uniref:Uncharacterized protein n=1 Tax=marine sediment metagenome TaxID=412755 RepID=A0A0F9EH20_9ZZZZ